MALPEPPCTLRTVTLASGATAAVHEWGGDVDASSTVVVFLHATGFHARCWGQVVAHLHDGGGASPPRCIGIDLRGHGRSSKPWPPAALTDPWGDASADVAEALDALGIRQAVLVGHSAGGWVAADVAASEAIARATTDGEGGSVPKAVPPVVGGLVLLDPVIVAEEQYDEYTALDVEERAAWKQLRYAGIERRYNAFPSAAAMRERFSGRPPYTDWQPQCLDDYCAHGLLTLEQLHELAHRVDGGDDGSPEEAEEALVGDRGEAAGAMVLACLPRFERAWYEGSRAAGRGAGLLHDLHKVTVPVDIVRSSLDGTNPDGSVNFSASRRSLIFGSVSPMRRTRLRLASATSSRWRTRYTQPPG